MLDVIKNVSIILISRLRIVFQAGFQKLEPSAEGHSEKWGTGSGRLRKVQKQRR